jgi:class 3 adenylate cyclase
VRDIPEIRYAKTPGGVHIAYQVVGDGPLDLVFIPGFFSNLRWHWELPSYARFLQRLAGFSRLIIVDRRGTGLSDRFSPDDLPPLEDLADDLEVVLDAVGSSSAALFGAEDAGAICALFAATRPERTSALILYAMDPGGPGGDPVIWEELFHLVHSSWGTRELVLWDTALSDPSRLDDEEFLRWSEAMLQLSASPATAEALLRLYEQTDVRAILPAIAVPTLIIHRTGDGLIPVRSSRGVAAAISGSRLVELPGDEHYWATGDNDAIADEIEEFLTGARRVPEHDRVLATVLFTDIVDSTSKSAAMGDRAWRDVRDHHDRIVREQIDQFRGREIKTMGDGFLATFDGPARGVRCAQTISTEVRPLGLQIRAGLHTGEVALDGDDIAGLSVAIGARVGAMAAPSEVLVSQTVKDLVAGSGLAFEDAGEHELKGVPDRWRLFRVVG